VVPPFVRSAASHWSWDDAAMATRVLLVDGTHLLMRGYAATSPGRSSDTGMPTNALFALIRALNSAIGFKQPDLAIAVLDAAALPADWSEDLRAQAEALPDILVGHGLQVTRSAEPEHAIAGYVRTALAEGHDAVIVGSDKRLAQLVGPNVWWYDAYKDVRYTPELVRKRFEVGPAQVADWLALVGDDDRLPGVKGIGKKGATTLIAEHGSVRRALAKVDDIGGRTGKALRAAGDSILVELDRAALDPAMPLPMPLSDAEFRAPDPSALQERYRKLSFWEMLSADGDATEVVVCNDLEQLDALLASDGPIALEVVTGDPTPVRGTLTGLALSAGDGRAVYLPFEGDGAVIAHDAPRLVAFLEDANRPKVAHDVTRLVVAFARRGITVRGFVGDTACASHLLQPSNWAPHDLPIVSKQVLQRPLVDDDGVRGVGRKRKPFARLLVSKTADFAGARAEVTAQLWRELSPQVEPAQLDEYLALSDTLCRMESRGIAVDGDDLARSGDDFEAIGAELEAEVHRLAGKTFNLGSTKQLGSVLFEDLGLPIFKRTKTGWSTATEALERIEHAHPIVPLVIRWRLLRRLTDSWVKALRGDIDADGRVRSTFYAARSFTGRIVNSNPDLGRVPGKTREMERIRHAFHAPAGWVLLSVDYQQLGLFVLAHLTKDPALVEPLAARADMHRLTAAAVLDLPADALSVDQRQLGKVVNFATFAGQGASALALQLGVDAAEAKRIIARFDERYAHVRRFQDGQLELARERGYIETISGRRWPIGDLQSRDHMMRSYAERLARRATHEGSVADVSRRGLLEADRALRAAKLQTVPLLQIHDEVLFEVPKEELADAARITADAMRAAYDLEVPLRVGLETGPNWAELEPLDATPAGTG
jgi:DNA polymerase I